MTHKQRMMWTVVLMAALAVACLVILDLSASPALLAQEAGTSPGQGEVQAVQDQPQTTLPPGVDPFILTLTADKDTWIAEASPHSNYGTDLELTVGQQDVGVNRSVTLVDFDLSTLPADAVPVSATLALYEASSTAADASENPQAVRFVMIPRAITTPWLERDVTWSNRPGSSYLGDPVVEHVPGGWTVFDVSDIVQGWLEGSTPQYGIFVAIDGTATGTRSYEARTAAHPPELTIYYTRQAVLEANQDTWVGAAQPSDSHGTDTWLHTASTNYSGGERLLLVGFDFASLPEDIGVISATLEMFTYWSRATVSSPTWVPYLYAEAMLSTWDENLTWTDARESLDLGDPPATYRNMWNEWDVTNIVQRWTEDLDPNGILVRAEAESTLVYKFYSREAFSNPPRLTVAYGAAPPTCNPVTSVQVSGVSTGVTDTEYTFEAVTLPADADPPESISWQATDHPERYYGDAVTLSWATPGVKTVAVLVTHCDGSTSTAHQVTIGEPPLECDIPLKGVHVSGPLVISLGSPYTYTALASPSGATLPISFTWQATDQGTSVEATMSRSSEQAYTWDVAGSMTISVTAENCAGSAADYYGVEVVPPADLPDLTISTAWLELNQDRIGYLIHNEGRTTAPAGFYVSFQLGSSTPAVSQHTSPLGPGNLAVGYLQYAWGCGGGFERVGVLADWSDVVVEVNEINNLWQANWDCDQQPPEIVGPEIVKLTETSAEVRWESNEECEGWLEYDTSPYDPTPNTAPGSPRATVHNATLSGLTAGTTYFVRAFCTDAAGLTANSEAVAFETLPLGAGPPRLRSLTLQRYPSSMYDFWELILEMEEDPYMDRVQFAMDGQLVGQDYSADSSGDYPTYSAYLSPVELGLSREEFFRRHTFEATAFRQHPDGYGSLVEDLTPDETDPEVSISILSPHNLQKVYVPGATVPAGTVLDVSVRAAAFDWHCTWGGFSEGEVVPPGLEAVNCNDLVPREVESIELWIDGNKADNLIPASGETLATLQGPIGGFALGSHQIDVLALAAGVWATQQNTFIVEQGEPSVEIERSVVREDNVLRVYLTLHNAGTTDAKILNIYDNLLGFQQVNRLNLGGDYRVSTWSGGPNADNEVQIQFLTPGEDGKTYLTLAPGADRTVSYVVVPILFEQEGTRAIGGLDYVWIELHDYQGWNVPQAKSYDLPATLVDDPDDGSVPLAAAVANAVREADFLIVTNPHRVYDVLVHGQHWWEAPELFANMAELAALENGVLGFLEAYDDGDVLDDLIEPGNYWAEALNPAFNEPDQGYVLIVGETEIVPAFYASGFNYWAGTDHVHDSDLLYADTSGETARPELVVGRVIGNELDKLNAYLERAIGAAAGYLGYGFNGSRAFITNGGGDGWEEFTDDAFDVDVQLDNSYDESTWINMNGMASTSQKVFYQANLPDQDLVLYRGHGSSGGWNDGFQASAVRSGHFDFGGTNPVMMAAACQTGNYEASGDDSDLGIAEALIWKGAGVYIGSTENSGRMANSNAFTLFNYYWQPHESTGQALNQLKRLIWGLDGSNYSDYHRLWVYEYNLYGDPKYGRVDALQTTGASQPQDGSLSVTAPEEGVTLNVALPALEFSRVGRMDRVQIPGGGLLGDPGTYPVPVWILAAEFRAGQQVQDVQLVARSGLMAIGSLSLPVVEEAIDCECLDEGVVAEDGPSVSQASESGWYPAQDRMFDWSVEELPNGNSMLHVVLYPFYYHAATGDGLYYRKYQLAVQTLDSQVRVESFDAGEGPYEPGDPVPLEIVVRNTGRPQDVIVQGSVRTQVTSEVLGGLPLKTLHGLTGKATVDLLWDTRPYEAGEYNLVVELLDPAGQLLDKAVTDVKLGTVSARLTGLTASQETFAPGDAITLRMGVQNTGSVPIDGVGVFRIQGDTDLTATEVLTVPFRGLDPGTSVKLAGVWDTRGIEGYNYHVLGYAKYRSQATEPLSLTLYRPRIFLPLVVRGR